MVESGLWCSRQFVRGCSSTCMASASIEPFTGGGDNRLWDEEDELQLDHEEEGGDVLTRSNRIMQDNNIDPGRNMKGGAENDTTRTGTDSTDWTGAASVATTKYKKCEPLRENLGDEAVRDADIDAVEWIQAFVAVPVYTVEKWPRKTRDG